MGVRRAMNRNAAVIRPPQRWRDYAACNCQRKKIFFAHVPKTGGSSVEDYLIRRFGGPLSLRDITHRAKNRKRVLIALWTHFTARDLDDVLPHDVDHCFAVVRDPLKRMESQYRFQAEISRTRFFGFSTWLRIMFEAVRIDPRVYQNHIRPQSDLVREGSAVFRLEDKFTDMIAWLDEVTDSGTQTSRLGRAREPIVMSRQDVELIRRFYKVDYERFGYDLPDPSAHADDRMAGLRWPLAGWWHMGLCTSSTGTGCAEILKRHGRASYPLRPQGERRHRLALRQAAAQLSAAWQPAPLCPAGRAWAGGGDRDDGPAGLPGFGYRPREAGRPVCTLLPQDPALPLTRAIATAVSELEPGGSLRLLYGDTLIREGEGRAPLRTGSPCRAPRRITSGPM